MSTSIDSSTFLRGRLRGNGDVSFAGRIEGDITVQGELTIEASGLVGANVSATTVIARGAVRGDIVATESIVLEQGARVVGDVRAPRIVIEEGALVRGYVESGSAGTASKASSHTAKAAAPAFVSRPQASSPSHTKAAPPKAAPAPIPAPVPAKHAKPAQAASSKGAPPRGSVLAGRAPAPVVPVLKKGTKAKRR